jgi:hypothetical protein
MEKIVKGPATNAKYKQLRNVLVLQITDKPNQ